MIHKLPFMSVIIISFNGEEVIGRAIESVLAQDYPKDRYEVIVVDDCSTDRTGKVARAYPVRYHRQPVNGGIANARNAGLAIARGDVYVCFDDDCYVDTSWLRALASGYQTDAPLGVGGDMVAHTDNDTLTQSYMSASNIEPHHRKQVSLFKKLPAVNKLISYAMSNFKFGEPDTSVRKISVGELYGANSSYDMAALRAVGGWNSELSGIEDRALCEALHAAFPERRFYTTLDAKIYHRPVMTLSQYLLRPFRRGVYNMRFHLKYKIIPPIFPSPCLYFGALIVASVVSLGLGLVAAVLLPLVLYPWWVRYAVMNKSSRPLLFSYFQLAEETMVIVGLIRGYVVIKRSQYGTK